MTDTAPWMIVMLENGVYQLGSTQSVPREALHPGSVVMVSDCNGETRAAKIVALSNDRNTVEDQMHSLEKNDQNSRVTSEIINDPEPGDYSSSGSSWAPDQQSSSDSESELPLKKVKAEPTKGYSKQKRKKQPRPALRPEPVLPRCWTPSRLLQETSERQTYDLSKKNGNDTKMFHKYIKPSEFHVSEQNIEMNNENNTVMLIESSEISAIKGEMEVIRDIVQKLKTLSNNLIKTLSGTREESFHSQSPVASNYSMERMTPEMLYRENGKCMNESTQETPVTAGLIHNRTLNHMETARGSNSRGELKTKQKKEDENQLETPSPKKHKSVKKENTLNNSSSSVGSELKEMVPIGSGKTLVPKEVYSKINWKSYTMATRKLLMAVFSRRTLATHSLTGKASPAFLSKPAKLCLDPKKVADIVMTVTANCHVKEGLVRSAITTKCADENKMLKLQMQKERRQRTLETSIRNKDLQENTADPRQD